jgi:membrane associated rhomboid family serine protease
MSYPYSEEQDSARLTPAVKWVIAINVAIYFVQVTMFGPAMQQWLGFDVGNLTERPWTVLTYMFVHAGFWHLAMNMYTLWLFGTRLERAWNPGSFVRYYLLCGLGGWLAHLMFARSAGLVGASAGVFGVMLAYAMRWPDDELLLYFVIPLKVKHLVALLAVVNLALGIYHDGMGGGAAYFAHLGGFAAGWLYLRWIASNPSLEGLRQRMSPIPDVPDEPPRAVPRSHPRPRERAPEVDDVVARSNAVTAKRVSSPGPTLMSKAGKSKADQLNDVLDKISQHGLGSLTGDERRLLEEMSKTRRDG